MKAYDKIKDIPNYMTYNGNHLFHYTSFVSALKIIASRQLLFGDFSGMNDISESRREVFNDKAIEELNMFKSISFTEDKPAKRGFEIDSLWGHYAEKGNGVCLVFDKKQLISCFKSIRAFKRFTKIKYVKDFTNALFLNDNSIPIAKQIEKNYKNIFFTKSVDWRYEHEYRFLLKSDHNKKDFLPFGDALKAVIICMPLTESVQETCEFKILNKLIDIPILRYHTNLGNKTLVEIGGEQLWPLLGIDFFLDL